MEPAELGRLWLERARQQSAMEPQVTLHDELKSKHYWKALRAEFIASFLLSLFTSSMAAQNDAATASLAMGVSLALNMYLFGAQSGGLGMPTLALALYTLRHVTALRCISFSFVQFLGTMLACGINYGLNSNATLSFGQNSSASSKTVAIWTQKHADTSIGRIFGFEFFGNFLIVLAVCHAWSAFKHYDDPNRQALQFFSSKQNNRIVVGEGEDSSVECNSMACAAPLYTGLMGIGAVCFAFDATQAILNPYRALWQAIFTDHWHHHWIYWVAAILASIFGAFTHDYLRTTPNSSARKQQPTSTEQHSPKLRNLHRDATQLTSISAYQLGHDSNAHFATTAAATDSSDENTLTQTTRYPYQHNGGLNQHTVATPTARQRDYDEYVTMTEVQQDHHRHPYHSLDMGQSITPEDDDDTENDHINHQTYRQYTAAGRCPVPRSHDTEITLLTTPVDTPNTDDDANHNSGRQHQGGESINVNRIVTSASAPSTGFLDSSV